MKISYALTGNSIPPDLRRMDFFVKGRKETLLVVAGEEEKGSWHHPLTPGVDEFKF
jgi:hypothetical protein